MLSVDTLLQSRNQLAVTTSRYAGQQNVAIISQQKAFKRWINALLDSGDQSSFRVEHMPNDLLDGITYATVLKILTGLPVTTRHRRYTSSMQSILPEDDVPPLTMVERLDNMSSVLNFMQKQLNWSESDMINLTASNLCKEDSLKLHLGLIWRLVLRFVLNSTTSSKNSSVTNDENMNPQVQTTSYQQSKADLLAWTNVQLCRIAPPDNCQLKNFTSSFQEHSTALPSLCRSILMDLGEYDIEEEDSQEKNNTSVILDLIKERLNVPVLIDAGDAGNDEVSMMTFLGVLRRYTTNNPIVKPVVMQSKQSTMSMVASVSTEETKHNDNEEIEMRRVLQQRRKEQVEREADIEVCFLFSGATQKGEKVDDLNFLAVDQNVSNALTQWSNKVVRTQGNGPQNVWIVREAKNGVELINGCGHFLAVSVLGIVYCDPESSDRSIWRIETDMTLQCQYLSSVFYERQKLCFDTKSSSSSQRGDTIYATKLNPIRAPECQLRACLPFTSGSLLLKEKGFLGNVKWKQGHWSFNGDMFCYWKKQKDSNVRNKAQQHNILDSCHVALLPEQMLYVTQKLYAPLRFSLTCEKGQHVVRTFDFKCASPELCKYWISAFRRRGVLIKKEKAKNQLTSPVRRSSAPSTVLTQQHQQLFKQQSTVVDDKETKHQQQRNQHENPPPQSLAKPALISARRHSAIAAAPSVALNFTPAPMIQTSDVTIPKGIVQFDFTASAKNQASVSEGQIITLVDTKRADWWLVQTSTGEQGFIPAAFVQRCE